MSADPRYKYTGKERDVETGYDYFGARYYDARIARWLMVDPLAEKYPRWSPYHYGANNPLRIIDPNGEDWKDFAVGVLTGIISSATPYQAPSIQSYGGDRNNYTVGKVVGDAVGALVGLAEMTGGVAGGAGGCCKRDRSWRCSWSSGGCSKCCTCLRRGGDCRECHSKCDE